MKNVKKFETSYVGYIIALANGQQWNIIGSEDLKGWVSKWATIMELQPYNSKRGTKLIVTCTNSMECSIEQLLCGVNQNFKIRLPKSGWKSYKVPYVKIWYNNTVKDIICGIQSELSINENIIGMWEALHPIYRDAHECGGLPLHAALVRWKEIGVTLAATGNTGKSTCCRRIPPPWYALCDDETLIVRNEKKQYLAHPFPTWSEYLFKRSERTWNVQQNLPLKAIFFLEQAEKDEVVPIGRGQAAILINQSVSQLYRQSLGNLIREGKRVLIRKLFDNACELAKAIPAYILRVSLTGKFWEEMEKVLSRLPENVSTGK